MPGNVSFVTLFDGTRLTTSRDKGDAMLRVLHGLQEPANQAQADYVLNIKSIYPELRTEPTDGLAAQTAYWSELDAKKQHTASVTAGEHLLNKGIYQSKDMSLPENDR